MMNYAKDYFERQMMNVVSMDTLEEMKGIVREGGSIHAPGRGKDDRVIAMALAAAAYAEQLQPRLLMERLTRAGLAVTGVRHAGRIDGRQKRVHLPEAAGNVWTMMKIMPKAEIYRQMDRFWKDTDKTLSDRHVCRAMWSQREPPEKGFLRQRYGYERTHTDRRSAVPWSV
jgi:hypothetical protein